jgi:hypothetical protein
MSDDADLSLVGTEALVKELFDRYDGVLIVREKERGNGSCDAMYDYAGGTSRAIGMCERIKARLLKMCEGLPEGCDPEDV